MADLQSAEKTQISGKKQGFSSQLSAQLSHDPNSASVITAWPSLPDAIRRAIMGLIGGQ